MKIRLYAAPAVKGLNLILLITTIVVFISLVDQYGMKCVSKHKDLQIFVLKINKYQ